MKVNVVGRWATVALAGVLLAGCASQVAGSATAGAGRTTVATTSTTDSTPTTPTSESTGTTESTETTETTETTESDPVDPGPIVGDPAAVVDVPDVSVDERALTDYLLPGFSGPGVECFADQVDLGLLEAEVTLDDAAQQVVDLLYACVDGDSIGLVLAMFAVGLDSETADGYSDLADCAGPEVGRTPSVVEFDLLRIYRQELTPEDTVDSAVLAADALWLTTDCLQEDEPPSSEVPPEAPGTPWEQLVTGQCVVDVPEGIVESVEVVDCTTPHTVEVVGTSADLAAGADPSAACQEATGTYLRAGLDFDLRITTLSSETDGVVAFACLVGTTGEPLTESLRG